MSRRPSNVSLWSPILIFPSVSFLGGHRRFGKWHSRGTILVKYWFTQLGLWTAMSASSENLLEMQMFWPHTRPREWEIVGQDPAIWSNKYSRWFWRTLMFPKHCAQVLENPTRPCWRGGGGHTLPQYPSSLRSQQTPAPLLNIHNIPEHRHTQHGLLKLARKDHDKDRGTKRTKTGKTKRATLSFLSKLKITCQNHYQILIYVIILEGNDQGLFFSQGLFVWIW